jgi:hypothetical protein
MKVDLPLFVDDFHFETKVTLDWEAFVSAWFIHHIFFLVAYRVWCMSFYEII